MSNSPKVRVTNKSRQSWYDVGEEYEVEYFNDEFFALSEDMTEEATEFRVISKDDCEVIE